MDEMHFFAVRGSGGIYLLRRLFSWCCCLQTKQKKRDWHWTFKYQRQSAILFYYKIFGCL